MPARLQNTNKQIVLLKRLYSIGDTIRLVHRLKKVRFTKKIVGARR